VQIGVPEVRRRGPDIEYSVRYALDRGGRSGGASLWYRVPTDFESMVSPRTDAAALALLIPAMAAGEELSIEGPVTDELVFRLNHGYQDVLQAVIPKLRAVEVVASDPVPAHQKEVGVATGFSAGVDSFTVLADHFYDPTIPTALKITHLILHRLGSHDDAGDAEKHLFLDRLNRASRVADKIGLPLVPVDTNVMEAYRGTGLNYQQTHGPRGASVAFLLQQGVGRWLYASALNFRHIRVAKYFDTAIVDPIALPLLSTSCLLLESHGGQYTRFEKTMRIAALPDTYWSLDVCVSGHLGPNCSKCFKCLRTLASLEIGGVLDYYADVFDLDVYRSHRETYFAMAAFSRDQLVRELLQEAKRRDFALPRPTIRRISPTLYRHAKSETMRYGKRLFERLAPTD
jgi:hypothetical protein